LRFNLRSHCASASIQIDPAKHPAKAWQFRHGFYSVGHHVDRALTAKIGHGLGMQ
jgi:hypothetical protein